jgi:ectoine hydroxylase-related dioxygenase (phytanoyl-CoA dioxygenase family)
MAAGATLPDLTSDYPLSQDQIDEYRRTGHVLLRAVCTTEEVAAYHAVITAAVKALNPESRKLEERDTYGKAFLQTMNLWVNDEGCKKYVFSTRFAQIAAQLMQVDGVRLYHDQALYKEPQGGHTPWHQDQHYWPLATDHTITMWMPLVDLDPSMGIMQFASGSHTEGYLGDMEISDASEARFREFVREQGYAITQGQPMQAGDTTFHSGWTLHSAPGNDSDRMREVMTIIYFPDGTLVSAADNKDRKKDLDTWLPGCRPGDLAASALNPVLWP